MDFSHIKEFIEEEEWGRYVIIQGGRPTHVVLPMDEYRRLRSHTRISKNNFTLENDTKRASSHVLFEGDTLPRPASRIVEESREINLEDLPF